MTFTAPNTPSAPEAQDKTIANNGFFSDLSLLDFRESMRVDSVTTAARAEHALIDAMATVNDWLFDFQVVQVDAGMAKLKDVPLRRGMFAGYYAFKYLRAVWSLAKANLIDRQRDSDTTKRGIDRAEQLDTTADDLRRDAQWAVSDIIGRNRSTIELI